MLYPRAASVRHDRDELLEFHCFGCYENDPEWFRLDSYEAYHEEWMATEQSTSFLEELAFSVEHEGAHAELWLSDTDIVGFLWLTFAEVEGYDLVVAEVRDLVVAGDRRDEGIGEAMIAHAEQIAVERGANLLRAGAGAANESLQTLLEGNELDVSHYSYEKVLDIGTEADLPRLRLIFASLLLLPALVIGCRSEGETPASGLSDSALANATYPVEFAPGGAARLTGGTFSAPGPAGSASGSVSVNLQDPRAHGDLNGDAAPDAAVVLAAQTGGTGTFYQLYAVLNESGSARPLAGAFLGDRIVLHSVEIDEGRITVKMRVAGPGDAACCPATEATHVYMLDSGELKLVPKTP